MVTRRRFLSSLAAAGAALPFSRNATPAASVVRSLLPAAVLRSGTVPAPVWRGESALSMGLAQGTIGVRDPARAPGSVRTETVAVPRVDLEALGIELRRSYSDLRRHFLFEYYPWYSTNPWQHWNHPQRQPPAGIAATSMPKLGPYDSRDLAVVEQHARWIADSGAGGINISWWGPGSYEDRAVHRIMDVMRDHDLRVTFHLEPFGGDRVRTYADDILYLLREYGEKRRWDAFLLLEDASGRSGPVFKSFRTIVPETVQDCRGNTHLVPDYVPDSTWRSHTDRLHTMLRTDFDRVTLLADVSDIGRMQAAGFDGMAIYDNFVLPHTWRRLAEDNTSRDLLFSFNVNPGFDSVPAPPPPPNPEPNPDPCYSPPPTEPGSSADWLTESYRERLAERSRNRIAESFRTTLALQTDPALTNARQGFLLVYINSFNEWHEGHQFEPMKDAAELTAEERQYDYRNPRAGDYRLRHLQSLMRPVVAG
jgi:hypothetical protein